MKRAGERQQSARRLPQSLSDDRGGLVAHERGSHFVEVHFVLLKIAVLDHEGVLVVGVSILRSKDGFGRGISGVDTQIGGSIRCVGLHRGGGRPDESAVPGQSADGVQEAREGGLLPGLSVLPSVHAVVEVHDRKRNIL